MNTRFALCAFFAALAATELPARLFTDVQGRTIEAELVAYDGGSSVTIRRADGQQFDLPLDRLSEDDQAYVRAWTPDGEGDSTEVSAEEIKRMNDLLGLPLFADGSLWDDSAEETARRLGWPQESLTDTLSSYRVYHGDKDRILGARPYSSALYGENGRVDGLSIVFANKGDSAAAVFDLTQSKMKEAVEAAIEADGETISVRLAELGEGKQQTTATGRGMKERLQRWDWHGHAILLAVQDEEYVAVRIMPSQRADNRGRPERVSSSELKARAKANVETRPNGDVVITNIPMVDQGPKGYCVPATLERALRYMGVRADMYLLAMAGQTSFGGGTYVSELIEGTEGYVKSAGRKLDEIKAPMKAKSVAKYIDDGQPVMWALFSSVEYNAMADIFTEARQHYADPKDWSKELSDRLKSASKLEKNRDAGHVCLIIGYNEETDEIAVSDSWGPRFAERWIPASQAAEVSQGAAWIVDF